MSQAIQAISSVSPAAKGPGTGNLGAESPESGQSFDSALAGQLADAERPADGPGATVGTPSDQTAESSGVPASELAAGGNPLPPPLPPTLPDVTKELLAEITLATDTTIEPARVTPDLSAAPTTETQQPASNAGTDAVVTAMATPLVNVAVVTQPAASTLSASKASAGSTEKTSIPASTAAEARTLAALQAEMAGTASATGAATKAPEMTASMEVMRAALKEIAPSVADPRPALLPPAVPGVLSPGSFATVLTGTAAATVPYASSAIPLPVGHNGWGQAFSNQVVWAVNQGMPGAELHLSPPELGPMSVRISLDQDQASLAFTSPHAAVREAIEAALPRLRDMLGSQGISLADVNVSQHGAANSQREPGDHRHGTAHGQADSGPMAMAGVALTPVSVGMLDIYV